ncbi:uncharacterized protein [Linepithema humile]|uniref:uncharacterized protein isoform X2 n=1 Tax=Linepithema humile TaxID=83485 RepID=UPI00351DF618
MATPPDSPGPEEAFFEFENTRARQQTTRPVPIEELLRQTKFSRQEIRVMYRGFKQECPEGVVHEDSFKDIYAKFFPHGRPPRDTVDVAARQHLREIEMDFQAVRHKRRRLYYAGRIGRGCDGGPRAHGQEASRPRRGGEEGAGTAGQGLQETRSQPGRRYHDRGVYRELSEGRRDYTVAGDVRLRALISG